MGNEPGQQASVGNACPDCGGLGEHTEYCHLASNYGGTARPLSGDGPKKPQTVPGARAHCSCGATAGVEEKPHAKGCPNHPEEQKRNLREFVAKNKPDPLGADATCDRTTRDLCHECGGDVASEHHATKCSRHAKVLADLLPEQAEVKKPCPGCGVFFGPHLENCFEARRTGRAWQPGGKEPGCPTTERGEARGPLSTGGRPKIEGCICGMDERDPKTRHSDACWRAARRRVQSGERFHPSFIPVEAVCSNCGAKGRECCLKHANTARLSAQIWAIERKIQEGVDAETKKHSRRFDEHFTGIPPKEAWHRCPACHQEHVHREDCPLRDGVKLKAQAARAHLEHTAADAFWAYWRENGETHKHGYYESTWGAIRAAIAAAPSFFRAATDCCPDCGAEWDPGAEEQHKKGCERAHAIQRDVDGALKISCRPCPCGKPSPPGDDTRTNLYRGDELVEVRYPHADGAQCCWTREKRR